MHYNLVVCGGTFDHFHEGHKMFLKRAVSISTHVLLGITSDAYIETYKNHASVQSFAERKEAVETFLRNEQAFDNVTIAPIDSIFYPKDWEQLPIEAIIVTNDTKKGAERINQERKQKGLSEVAIYVAPLLPTDAGKKISSSTIREGKINEQGTSYIQPSWFAKDLFLPEVEKRWFKHPFGTLYTDTAFLTDENHETLITVGDAVTKDCNSLCIKQKLSVIDFTIQRKHTFKQIQDLGFTGNEKVYRVSNPASHITTALVQIITQAITLFHQKKQLIIVVEGEEDLAVIPLVLALPLNYVIIYGQPNEGIVKLSVTSETKDKAYNLLQKFITTPLSLY